MEIVVFGLLGLIVGSFLNVVILRLGEKSLGGRSACPSCGTQLRFFDLIPVLSFLALRGRCRYCSARISIQYPLVEIATAAFFVLIAAAGLPIHSTVLALIIVAFLICMFAYDLRYKLIPDVWVWPFCILALVFSVFFLEPSTSNLEVVLAGPLTTLPILLLWALSYPFTGSLGQWMGFGDVKLALGIGWLLAMPTPIGLPLGLISIFLAFVIGAAVSVTILLPLPHYMGWWRTLLGRAHAGKSALFRQVGGISTGSNVDDHTLPTMASKSDHADFAAGYTMKSEVPFGPFLIASGVLIWFAVLYDISIPLFI
ncbi:MAG TPA: prepilin peptidase [Candidatus Paceibacterota bacterium]